MNGASQPQPETPTDSREEPRPVSGPLKSRLFLLAASGLVPLVIMIALALGFLIDQRQRATQRSAQELSRALATAVDAELRSTVSLLRTLAGNDELAAGRLEQFYAPIAMALPLMSIKGDKATEEGIARRSPGARWQADARAGADVGPARPFH